MISNIKILNLKENKKDFFWDKFNEISDKCHNHSAIYKKEFFLYQKEYCISNNTLIEDKSFIITNENKAECAGIFFLIKDIENNYLEISFGKNIPGLLLISNDVKNKSISLLKEMISSLLANSSKIIFTTPEKCNFDMDTTDTPTDMNSGSLSDSVTVSSTSKHPKDWAASL